MNPRHARMGEWPYTTTMAAKFAGQPPTNGKKRQCESAKPDGTRCPASPIRGGNVCQIHGGRTPVVAKAARERFAELVNPSIAAIAQVVKAKKGDKHVPVPLRTQTARWVLEANGYRPTDEVVVTQRFDPSRFAHMSDDEIATFVALGRKASRQVDARELAEEGGHGSED